MENTVDLLQIKINKAREELPKETIEAIDAVDWKSMIIKMREEKGYSFEQLENLEIETELLLCGLTNTENYPKELETRMNLPKAQIDELVNEMNEKVFIRIREELIKRIEKNKKTTEPKENLELESREEMLKHIENPEPVKSINNYELRITNENKPITNDQLRITNSEESKKDTHPVRSDEGSKSASTSNGTHSLLMQKLSGSFKIPSVETDHSLKNLQPSSTRNETISKKIDPYREPTE
ncbi:hypothetical protein COU48_01080 [Candidatus Nomurabacteria bacterium CG10_big_fil_rev_8_21_14_0_10_03_31_7]|uniref:Uncharacterized protein n=1 Tax=Candidatus Nomurabacteria bacterium CG10_big_fil_rev_8_21_14_0_10_03_31_7 TaxID=1974730 RepID=A0A2J0JI64_9BACT|nr:MAG: hypothetical protein COU48_01080 [Candidatus Nomurabacteria bacterium CG10_big_fil_rev_8_21_14_0_10_03_31_7]